MAACGSLQRIFETPLPETQMLFDSFESVPLWNNITSIKPINDSSISQMFVELDFKESNHVDSSSLTSPLPLLSGSSAFSSSSSSFVIKKDENNEIRNVKSPESFMDSDSCLSSSCTESHGFESSDDVEDLMAENNSLDYRQKVEKRRIARYRRYENLYCDKRTRRGSFPPPISSIASNGKPWVQFKSYRKDGRFILKEIRIPNQEFLHSSREDGRLTMQFVSDDEMLEDDDEDEDEDETEDETQVNDDLKNIDDEDKNVADEETKQAQKNV